jgi:uncharacterized coiled-coil DUF342 family protein
MKLIANKIAATSLFVALCVLPSNADSDYGLVVNATNKLIDKFELVKTDIKTLTDENSALREEIAELRKKSQEMDLSYKQRLEAMNAQISSKYDGMFKEMQAGLSGAQIRLSELDGKISRVDNEKRAASLKVNDESVNEQERRLQNFLNTIDN